MSILRSAADVLRCFGKDRPDLTVSDVVRLLDMPKANASRLLKAMREANMLETIGDTHRHRPGRLMLDLATAYRRSSNLIGRASDVVAEVSNTFGHTGYITVRDGTEVTAVVDFPGTNALRVVSSIGRRLPAHLSATGRTLLARLSDEQVSDLYADSLELEGLMTQLQSVRSDGFAYASQEATPGVDGIAIAVADPLTDETVSLCIVYPHALVDEAGRNAMIAALAKGASAIARDLGDKVFVEPKMNELEGVDQ